MPRSRLDKFLGVVPDGYSARPEGGWGKSKPTQREVRMGDRFSDGERRTVRDTRSGRYLKESDSPKEIMKVVKDARGKDVHVVVERSAPTTVVEEDSCTITLIGFFLGAAAIIDGIVRMVS